MEEETKSGTEGGGDGPTKTGTCGKKQKGQTKNRGINKMH